MQITKYFYFLLALTEFSERKPNLRYNTKRLIMLGFNGTTTLVGHITKTRLFKYIEHFTSKNRKFSDKKL